MYVEVRNIINLQVHVLFLAAGVLENKVRERVWSMFTFFSNPLLCLRFQKTQRDERKGTKDYIELVWFKKLLLGLRY